MKLTTENHFHYYLRKNDQFYRVDSLSLSDSSKQLDFIDACLMDNNGNPLTENVSNLNAEDKPYTDLYVRVRADIFFQIGAIANSEKEANQMMLERTDIALIDSTTMSTGHQYHFLASLEPAKTN